jgi:hypothetical protein
VPPGPVEVLLDRERRVDDDRAGVGLPMSECAPQRLVEMREDHEGDGSSGPLSS